MGTATRLPYPSHKASIRVFWLSIFWRLAKAYFGCEGEKKGEKEKALKYHIFSGLNSLLKAS
jgi:hypothetical protein